MSAIAKRAIDFYLANSEIVEGLESAFGHTHEVHSCPSCSTAVVMRDGELVEVSTLTGDKAGDNGRALSAGDAAKVMAKPGQLDEGELVVC